MIPLHLLPVAEGGLLAAAVTRQPLDNLDKVLVAAHVGALGVYVVTAAWIKLSLLRAQRVIPPAQAAIVGQRVGTDFTVVSWAAFAVTGASGYWLLGRAGLADPASPQTLFVNAHLLDSAYGWKILIMIALWYLLVISSIFLTFVFRPRLTRRLAPTDPPASLERLQQEQASAVRWIDILAWFNLVVALGAFLAGFAISFDETVLRIVR